MSAIILLLTGVWKEVRNIDSRSIKKVNFSQVHQTKHSKIKTKLRLMLSWRRHSHVGVIQQVRCFDYIIHNWEDRRRSIPLASFGAAELPPPRDAALLKFDPGRSLDFVDVMGSVSSRRRPYDDCCSPAFERFSWIKGALVPY